MCGNEVVSKVRNLSRVVASSIAELGALTTTPFMVEIVMQILRQLQRLRGTDAVMKQQLALLLDNDDATEHVWGLLSAWRRERRKVLAEFSSMVRGHSAPAASSGQ